MKLQRQKLNKTIEWESFSSSFFISCCYLLLIVVLALALLQLHLNSHWFTHSIASHRIAGVRFGSHRIASHLISFALQRFVSLLRFALEARAGNGFSLIESKCCSDRMEMWRGLGGGSTSCWCLSGNAAYVQYFKQLWKCMSESQRA